MTSNTSVRFDRIEYGKEMLNSAALRSISPLATKYMHVFEAELVNGAFNSKVRVPQSLILEWTRSKRKGDVSAPIMELHAFGFIRPGAGPRLVRVTYFPVGNTPPTNEWRLVTFEQADEIIEALKKRSRGQTEEYQARIQTGDWPKRR